MSGTTESGADARRLAEIAAGAAQCNRCDLYRRATQTVFGDGPVPAAMMLVGEQPGDQEDKRGAPFVGCLFAVSAFLLAYNGFSRKEMVAPDLARWLMP